MKDTNLSRWLVFLYGVACYVLFFGVFLYAIGFIGNFLVPTTLDAPTETSIWSAFIINGVLLGFFAVQHSGMARPRFKAWLTRYLPQPMERSTYVLLSCVAMILIYVFWQPMGISIWNVTNIWAAAIIYGVFAMGWVTVFVSTCLIDHFDLFGLRQVWLYLRGKPYTPSKFTCPGPYQWIRHPLYVGWLMTFWATPTMTLAHFVFAVGCTAYILVAIQLEERDLIDSHGNDYLDYQLRVPMLIPNLINRTSRTP